MAATSSTPLTPAMLTVGRTGARGGKAQMRTARAMHYVRGLNAFGGLRAHNNVLALGMPVSTEQCFAKVVSSLRAVPASAGKGKNGGGALSAQCNAVAEIFKIAAIMNGLTLIGVAAGFVLLRIEATFEESE